jgi:hypothetical protein
MVASAIAAASAAVTASHAAVSNAEATSQAAGLVVSRAAALAELPALAAVGSRAVEPAGPGLAAERAGVSGGKKILTSDKVKGPEANFRPFV